jgi:hypothetical protein
MLKQIERKRARGRSGGRERRRERSGAHSIKKMANIFVCELLVVWTPVQRRSANVVHNYLKLFSSINSFVHDK